MTVNDFITNYKKNSNNYKFDKHLKTKYVKYEEKSAMCIDITKASHFIEVDGKSVFKQNTLAEYMMFTLKMINLYTDIDIDFTKALDEFNLIQENDVLDDLLDIIPAKEYEQATCIIGMVKEDMFENTRSIPAYIDKKIGELSDLLNAAIVLSTKVATDQNFATKIKAKFMEIVNSK